MPILATSGDGGGGGAVTVMPTRNTKKVASNSHLVLTKHCYL